MTWLIVILKDLPRRAASDKVWHDKAFNIAKSSKCYRYQRALATMHYKVVVCAHKGTGINPKK